MLGVYIFLLILVGQLITWIGKTRLNDWAHRFYLFITRSQLFKAQKDLRRTILKTKVDFQSTSSQDQFAKWARLRRKIDKELAELDQLNKRISNSKAHFSTFFSSLIWSLTTGLQFILISWYRHSAVFYIPQDWFPAWMVWFLSFPSAPYGTVSTTVWTIVCKRTLATSSGIFSDLFFHDSPSPEDQQPSSNPNPPSSEIRRKT